MTDENGSNRGWLGTTRRKVLAAGAAALAAGGFFGAQAMAQSKSFSHLRLAAMDGGWHGGWHRGRHSMRFDEMSAEELESHISRMVRHASIEIEATDEQEQRIISLLTAAAREIMPLRAQMRETREKVRELLLADAVDREALEELRQRRLADLDRISQKLTVTLADVAEVLTPDQRRLAEERLRSFRRMRRWHRG